MSDTTVSPSGLNCPLPNEATRIRYEKRGRVAYITLDRPHVLNALDLKTHEELGNVWDDYERDDDLWLAVLTGAGDRAFSVGQDLKELVERTLVGAPPSSFGSKDLPGWPRLTQRFGMTKPVIARVNGYALGGGFELALACDIIVASDHSSFGLPEAKLGLIPGAGGLFRLTRQIPFRTAMGYLLTGRNLSAQRAYELGLINEVVAAGELDACVDHWIDDILRCAPLSVRSLKQVAHASAHLSVEQAFAGHYEAEKLRQESADTREGPLAFIEKRPPRWSAK